MRLWTLSPLYLDTKGLLAVWREALLAKHVLEGRTVGYKNHPQLNRFKQSSDPELYINAYLHQVFLESQRRGYQFDPLKFKVVEIPAQLSVTSGQLEFELSHLQNKLAVRAPQLLATIPNTITDLQIIPMFTVVPGDREPWEIVTSGN